MQVGSAGCPRRDQHRQHREQLRGPANRPPQPLSVSAGRRRQALEHVVVARWHRRSDVGIGRLRRRNFINRVIQTNRIPYIFAPEGLSHRDPHFQIDPRVADGIVCGCSRPSCFKSPGYACPRVYVQRSPAKKLGGNADHFFEMFEKLVVARTLKVGVENGYRPRQNVQSSANPTGEVSTVNPWPGNH